MVGVGLNVCNPLPADLQAIATTLALETGKIFSVEEVRERLIEELQKERSMQQYLSYVGYMGREATLLLGDECIHGTLVSVDEEGVLTVNTKKGTLRLTSAEVSVRL